MGTCKKGCVVQPQSINENGNTFRQDTIGHFQLAVLTVDEQLVPQPEGLPTIEVVFIDPVQRGMVTVISTFQMYQTEPGRYFFDWRVPIDEPLLVHQVIYRGKIGDLDVIGEDIFTVLPVIPNCVFTPTMLTTMKLECGCRR